MLTHSHATASGRVPYILPRQLFNPGPDLVDALGGVEDEWAILLIGNGCTDLMCALLHAGASKVTHLRSHEHLEVESASLAIVPRAESFEWLEAALGSTRRALIASGRVAVCVDALPVTQSRAARLLARHGFCAVRTVRVAGCVLLTGEVPACGLRRCA